MPKRTPRFSPNEVPTDPELRRAKTTGPQQSGRAPKSRRERAEAPTIPPPKSTPKGGSGRRTEPAAPKARKAHDKANEKKAAPSAPPPRSKKRGGAAVDEVVADMSRDPRREKD